MKFAGGSAIKFENRNIMAFLLIGILLIGAIAVSGCVNKQSNKDTIQPQQYPEVTDKSFSTRVRALKGVSLSPKSFNPADFTDFFEKVKQTGEIVSWAGGWYELSNTQSGGPVVVASLASEFGYVPIIETQFFTQSSGRMLRPLDNNTKQIYKTSAADFADKYKPEYFAIGIEVNTLYAKSSADFDNFTQFYSEISNVVKAKSPGTKVFTIFQLEKMKGLDDGLFGGTNDPAKAQWTLLDRFSKSDIIAFTTYPGLIYKDPSEIPTDYYTEIKLHTLKPIAFTEIGWHSDDSPEGWESSNAEQAKFVEVFFSLMGDLNKEFVIWTFMYDQDTFEPFRSMGLRSRIDGTAKPAWDEWLNVK
ncbi:MAG: hypothetical protein M1365_08535 [Actinobacteria bacterium]|nr:hypothetical protein [Actinomycetota bacterium]